MIPTATDRIWNVGADSSYDSKRPEMHMDAAYRPPLSDITFCNFLSDSCVDTFQIATAIQFST